MAPKKRGPKVDVQLTQKRKRDIVREAARLFDQIGYHGVNMEMIAEAAGLKKPTLYHYFKGKEEILFVMQDALILSLRERMRERIAKRLRPLEILQGIYEDIFGQLHDSPGVVRSFFEHQRELGAEFDERMRRERNAYTTEVMKVFSAGMDRGEIARTDVRLLVLTFFGISNWAYQWYRPGRDPAPQIIARQCFDLFCRGMFPR